LDHGQPNGRERVLLVGVRLANQQAADTEDHLDELSLLTNTAGGMVVSRVLQERARFDPAYLIGKGKAQQIGEQVRRDGIQTVIFDDELSPAQIRNLETAIGVKVIDRAALILDIFAGRARSREARTQVELAQMQYMLPRLTRRWSHLSRQAGGTIGLRGVGETQLEIDRRLIRMRIARLRRELDKVERGRTARRRRREEAFKAALVGYTNAGKSTLFNALSGMDSSFVEDRLFATLDPLVRRCWSEAGEFLLIDTVGFIRKLPHHLVASFRSTLEESVVADLLVHVIDLSHPGHEDQMDTTRSVLSGMGLAEHDTIQVFNKIDAAESGVRSRARKLHPGALFVSALGGEGVEALGRIIGERARASLGRRETGRRTPSREVLA
jgi:GTP-binding protein HflX